jgi:hypothetical protein
LGLNGSATSGTAKAILRDYAYAGAGTGSGTQYSGTRGFIVEIIGVSRDSAKSRVFFGNDGVDLTGEGFGIEFDNDGINLLAHDGTTRSSEAVDLLDSKTGVSNFYQQPTLKLQVETTGGIVTMYDLGIDGTKAEKLVHTMTGGPEGSSAGTSRRVMAGNEATGISNALSPRLVILEMQIY